MAYGKNLKELMKIKKIKMSAISDNTGISLNTLYSITSKDQEPRQATREKLEEFLNLSESEQAFLYSGIAEFINGDIFGPAIFDEFIESCMQLNNILISDNDLSDPRIEAIALDTLDYFKFKYDKYQKLKK